MKNRKLVLSTLTILILVIAGCGCVEQDIKSWRPTSTELSSRVYESEYWESEARDDPETFARIHAVRSIGMKYRSDLYYGNILAIVGEFENSHYANKWVVEGTGSYLNLFADNYGKFAVVVKAEDYETKMKSRTFAQDIFKTIGEAGHS